MDPIDALLNEGGSSYVPAISAILAFRELVIKRCRQMVLNRLGDYSTALGTELNEDQFRNWDSPKLDKWDGQWASLGLEIAEVGNSREYLYHTVQWEQTGEGQWLISATASIWTRTRAKLDKLSEAFRAHTHNLNIWTSVDDYDIGIYIEVPPTQMMCFETIMDTVYQQWIKLWQDVGGLK